MALMIALYSCIFFDGIKEEMGGDSVAALVQYAQVPGSTLRTKMKKIMKYNEKNNEKNEK